jgi:thymidylate synthase (FAD)
MLPSEAYVYWVEELLRHFPERRKRLEEVRGEFERQNRQSYALYRKILEGGVAREIARCVLPLSMYTEWYWKVDLHNLLHFLRLRMDAHAQLEIRVFAEALATFVKPRVPFVWDAFESEVLRGTRMSDAELGVLRPADAAAQREVLRALHARGYRERRLKETCRKLGIDEGLVDELWPGKPK